MKEFLIQIYGTLVMILVFVGIILGIYISYNFASLGYYFNLSTFLYGIGITVSAVALLSGLLLIQLQNNELLKEIKKNTDKARANMDDEENKKLKEKIFQENKARNTEEQKIKS